MELYQAGASINYEVWENGHQQGLWVTLINGHTRPLTDFRMLGKRLVEAGFRVLVLDNRGAGKTAVTRPFTLDDMVSDVAALWRELGVSKTALLGISMGGFIAQQLARQYPEHISRLILVSTAATSNAIRRDGQSWSNDPKKVEAKLLPYFTEDFVQRNPALVKSMVKQIAKAVAESDFAAKGEMQIAAISNVDNTPFRGEIQAPTLVIHGDQDRIIPPHAATDLAHQLPNAKLDLIPDAGHLLLAERPRELYDLILAFVPIDEV